MRDFGRRRCRRSVILDRNFHISTAILVVCEWRGSGDGKQWIRLELFGVEPANFDVGGATTEKVTEKLSKSSQEH